MNLVKRLLIGVGAFALAGMLVAMLAPMTAHAIVGKLASVTKSSADIVRTAEASDPTYEPASLVLFANNSWTATATVPTTLPSGAPIRQMVINWVTGFCIAPPNVQAVALQTNSSEYSFFGPVASGTAFGVGGATPPDVVFGTKTSLYASPGSTVTLTPLGENFAFEFNSTTGTETVSQGGSGPICLVNVEGYYIKR